jgi:ATP-dependent Clp protease protease subunit
MAGDEVLMSPAAYLMIHNPWTITAGNSEEMRITAQQLDEIKEGVINAYEVKTGLPRDKLSGLMDSETYMNARKAIELGFADEVLYEKENEREYERKVLRKRNGEEGEKDEYEKEEYEKDKKENKPREFSVSFSQKIAANRALAKIRGKPLKQELKEKEKKEELKRKPLDEEAKRQEEKEELKEQEGKKNMKKKKDEDEKEAAKTKLDYRKYHEILNKLKI